MERTFQPRMTHRAAPAGSVFAPVFCRPRARTETMIQRVALGHSLARIAAGEPSGAVLQRKIPPTKVQWTTEKVADSNNKLTFTYPVTMEAIVSSDPGGYKGSGPDGKSDWWPYFQQRHKVMKQGKVYWVQGHLLNDNLHGPGTSENLVPLSNTSNTNMETKGERTAKDTVKNGGVIHYIVKAKWNQSPDTTYKNWGGYDSSTGIGLLPGECTAPTSISWEVRSMKEQSTDVWVDDKEIQPPEDQWYNTFPTGKE